MVLKDLFSTEINHLRSKELNVSLAPPSDRLLASFFDFLFHIPFFSLASFIILYRLNLLKLTIATTSELMAVVAQLVWVALIGSIVLNSIYLKFWKKTPGMRLMKLEVRSINQNKLTWEQCLLRSGVWAVEVLLFGLPLLVILSHSRRQSFHDRISETEVISLKIYGALSPLPAEKALVSLITTALIMLGLGWMTAFFSLTQKGIQNGSLALSEWREQGQLCSQVDEISTYSNVDLSNLSTRLDFSIGLFMLEQVDNQCLSKEIEFAFFKKVSSSLVWVGRALLSPLYSEERTSYITKACEGDSRWCAKSLLHEKAPLNEAIVLMNEEKSKNLDNKNNLLSYIAAKLILFNRIGANTYSQNLIQILQNKGIRATGLVAEHLKVISREHPEELSTALATLQSVMVEKDFLRLNAEICLRQLEMGCSSKINECKTMTSLISAYKNESLNDLTISRAVFKESVCSNKLESNMEYWTLINNKSLQKLIQIAIEVDNEMTQSQSLVRLRNFVRDESETEELRFDALQLLISNSNYSKDWLLVSQYWNQLHWSQSLYLSASSWIMREAKRNRQDSLILSMEATASKVPGLKLDWNLLQQNLTNNRIPASSEKEK